MVSKEGFNKYLDKLRAENQVRKDLQKHYELKPKRELIKIKAREKVIKKESHKFSKVLNKLGKKRLKPFRLRF